MDLKQFILLFDKFPYVKGTVSGDGGRDVALEH
jgi:hypothetical protein